MPPADKRSIEIPAGVINLEMVLGIRALVRRPDDSKILLTIAA
jgi:hypothetical protein